LEQLPQKQSELWGEIAHHYDSGGAYSISSIANHFRIRIENKDLDLYLPVSISTRLLSRFRIIRRILRLDKSNAVFNFDKSGVILIYRSDIYYFDLQTGKLKKTGTLQNSRNVLHQSVCVTDEGIYIGEYGANKNRNSVPVWKSKDAGRSWNIAYEFPADSIKHTHGVYLDPYSGKLWIPTGDADGDCCILVTDQDFRHPNRLFTEDKVIWGMDSPLVDATLQIYDRISGELEPGQQFQGPVWYSKEFCDGVCILQTSVEPGAAVTTTSSKIYASEDYINWHLIAEYEKDRWPMIFKFGVIAFSDGKQSSHDFLAFGEGLTGFDGKIKRFNVKTPLK